MDTLTLKIEQDLKKQAQEIADELGISLSALLKMLLKNTIRRGKIDIDLRPRFHDRPEEGDLVFKDGADAIKYFEKLADEDGQIA